MNISVLSTPPLNSPLTQAPDFPKTSLLKGRAHSQNCSSNSAPRSRQDARPSSIASSNKCRGPQQEPTHDVLAQLVVTISEASPRVYNVLNRGSCRPESFLRGSYCCHPRARDAFAYLIPLARVCSSGRRCIHARKKLAPCARWLLVFEARV